ncbi:hypothetical protein [Nocardioides humi]|uniref:DUF4386 family protein n=1 Tax=Nocardioides humi TaxID=449461 RepID=A0ABN1ZR01_9ACTN|nr:hypothetical protein [Nocardioides humi]
MTTPASHPGRRFTAVAVILAPVVFLLSDVAYISAGEGINNGVLGGTIGIWSVILLGWALVGISRALEPVAPRGALALLVLAIPAMVGGAAFNLNALHRDHFGNDFMEAADSGGDAIGLLAFLPWGWCAPAALVVAGVFVWRTAIAPRWAGAVTALAGVLFVSARPAALDALAVVCDVTMVLGLVPIGLALLRRSSASEDLGATRVPAGA